MVTSCFLKLRGLSSSLRVVQGLAGPNHTMEREIRRTFIKETPASHSFGKVVSFSNRRMIEEHSYYWYYNYKLQKKNVSKFVGWFESSAFLYYFCYVAQFILSEVTVPRGIIYPWNRWVCSSKFILPKATWICAWLSHSITWIWLKCSECYLRKNKYEIRLIIFNRLKTNVAMIIFRLYCAWI